MKNIVWLSGYPKSGNTWMRLFLHAYLAGRTGLDALGRGDIGDLHRPFYEKASPVPLEDLTERETIYLRPAALLALTRRPGGDQLVKTHSAKLTVDGIELIPPEMTKAAVYIVRDPRDVAISFAHHIGESVDHAIYLMGKDATLKKDNLTHYLGTWSQNVDSWSKGTFPILLVRYEDMLSGEAFRSVAHFFIDECDEEKLKFAIEATDFQKLQAEEQEKGFRECSPKADRFFRECGSTWRDVLTPDQIRRIEADHGETMARLGYLGDAQLDAAD